MTSGMGKEGSDRGARGEEGPEAPGPERKGVLKGEG